MANFMPDPFENNEYESFSPRRGGGFFGKFVAFLLGIIFFIGASVAATIAVEQWMLSLPIGDTVNKIDTTGELYKLLFGTTDEDGKEILGYLNPDFAGKKVGELLEPITNVTEELISGKGSLGTLEQLTPQIKIVADAIVDTFAEIGIELESEKILSKPFSKPADAVEGEPATLVEYLIDGCYSSPIATLIGYEKYAVIDDDIMMAFCYGKKGEAYTIVDNKVQMNEGYKPKTLNDLTSGGFEFDSLMDDILLADLVTVESDNTLMMYVLYGKKDVHYEVDTEGKVTVCQKQVSVYGGKLYNEFGETLDGTVSGTTLTIGDETYTLSANAGKTVKITAEDENKGEDAQLYFVFESDGTTKVMFEATKISDLTGSNSPLNKLTSRITIGELLDITEEKPDKPNKILYNLRNETMDTMPDAIDNLKIGDMIDGASDNTVLKHLQDSTIKTLSSDIENLTVNQLFENDIYEEVNGVKQVKGTWKYMLKKEDGTIGKYKISEMNSLIDNMTRNIHSTTLNQLCTDNIIELDDSTMLTKPVLSQITVDVNGTPHSQDIPNLPDCVTGANGATKKTSIGDMTTSELIAYINALLNAIS